MFQFPCAAKTNCAVKPWPSFSRNSTLLVTSEGTRDSALPLFSPSQTFFFTLSVNHDSTCWFWRRHLTTFQSTSRRFLMSTANTFWQLSAGGAQSSTISWTVYLVSVRDWSYWRVHWMIGPPFIEICKRGGQIMQRRLLCSRNQVLMCTLASKEDRRPRHLVCQHIRL
jgi:hypothetical protein